MTVVDDIRWIVDQLRLLGQPVEYVTGWETRGKGAMARVDGQLCHHDAFPPSSGPAGGLNTCTFGRRDLRNSLCMFYVASDGVIHVVAAGVSWHAGTGLFATNSTWSGIEARNDGRGEPWPEIQLDAYALLNAMSALRWGFGSENVRDHKEHAPTRKIDRALIDPPAWRLRVAAVMRDLSATQLSQEDDSVYIIFTPVAIALTGKHLTAGPGHTYLALSNGTSRWVATKAHLDHLRKLEGVVDAGNVGDDWFSVWPPLNGPHVEEYGSL